jgi:hypothetical protein
MQSETESVATPLVCGDAPNFEVLPNSQPVNTVGDLAVFARLLDSRTEVAVPERDAGLVAARGIDNLPGTDGAVAIDPVATTTTVGGGWGGDLFTFAALLCW